ncbi:GGDEF domain-containing response regulator [Planctobacterium marinum]
MQTSNNYKYRILVVEDDIANRQIVAEKLQEDYQLTLVDNKADAMDALLKQQFEIVLLDIGLPDGSGLDICREVKANHDVYGEINIVFMTGRDKPADEIEGIRLGANDYISKPINVSVLKARVDLQAQLIRKTELLANLARIDGLTEIPNRRAFDDYLEKSWSHARRISAPISLAMLDIDFFKQYNDIYGHPAGDECLKALANCLRNNIKRGADHIARYGGEEFAVILFDCDLQQANTILNELLADFANLCIPHAGSSVADFATFSCGVCTLFPEDQGTQALLTATDKLLYEAKSEGRNRVKGEYFHNIERQD